MSLRFSLKTALALTLLASALATLASALATLASARTEAVSASANSASSLARSNSSSSCRDSKERRLPLLPLWGRDGVGWSTPGTITTFGVMGPAGDGGGGGGGDVSPSLLPSSSSPG